MPNSQWVSVTGQTIDLSLQSGFLGKCSSIQSFEKLNHLGEGSKQSGHSPSPLVVLTATAYGVVYRARELSSSKIVALKQVRISPEERHNGVPITALREISILRSLKHNNIVNVLDVAVGETAMDEIYMVMEYAEQVGGPLSGFISGLS